MKKCGTLSINVTSFFSISYYSNTGIDLKNVFRTKIPVLYLNGGQK